MLITYIFRLSLLSLCLFLFPTFPFINLGRIARFCVANANANAPCSLPIDGPASPFSLLSRWEIYKQITILIFIIAWNNDLADRITG